MDQKPFRVGLRTQDLEIQGTVVPAEDYIPPDRCTGRAPGGQIFRWTEACKIAQGESCHGHEVVPGKRGPAKKGEKVLIKEGWGPGRGVLALEAPNGLGNWGSINEGCGEAQVYGPGSEACEINPDGCRGEARRGAEGDESKGIGGGDGDRAELVLVAENIIFLHCCRVGGT